MGVRLLPSKRRMAMARVTAGTGRTRGAVVEFARRGFILYMYN
jgi:hypothetical protein